MALPLSLFFCFVAAATVWILAFRVWWLPELVSVHGAAIDRQFVLTLIVALRDPRYFFRAEISLGVFYKYETRRGAAELGKRGRDRI